jgi:hypothetical protein
MQIENNRAYESIVSPKAIASSARRALMAVDLVRITAVSELSDCFEQSDSWISVHQVVGYFEIRWIP